MGIWTRQARRNDPSDTPIAWDLRDASEDRGACLSGGNRPPCSGCDYGMPIASEIPRWAKTSPKTISNIFGTSMMVNIRSGQMSR